MDLIIGARTTVKFVALSPNPAGVVTRILPVAAPAGTVAVTCVAEFTVNGVAATPPKLTAVAPVKFVPVIVTTVPAGPLAGVKLATTGSVEETVKFVALSPNPAGVVTRTLPVTAPAGTVAVICVAEFTVMVIAAAPPKLTPVAPVKFVPVIVTTAPAGPLAGVKLATTGSNAGAPDSLSAAF
jgi:hypothetical protein